MKFTDLKMYIFYLQLMLNQNCNTTQLSTAELPLTQTKIVHTTHYTVVTTQR